MKIAFGSLLLVFGLLPALASSPGRASQTDDIREATFRYMFRYNASGQQQRAGAYYLAIDSNSQQTDPGDAFMKRFADNKPPVKKVSECTSSVRHGVRDKKTQEIGLIFNISAIRWRSDTEAEVDGGYYEDGLSASGNTYYLKKEGGKWKIFKAEMHWIS